MHHTSKIVAFEPFTVTHRKFKNSNDLDMAKYAIIYNLNSMNLNYGQHDHKVQEPKLYIV